MTIYFDAYIFVYPIAKYKHTLHSVTLSKPNSWFLLHVFLHLHRGHSILLAAQAKNLGVTFKVPSLLGIPHNQPANPVILSCGMSRIWPLLVSSTAAPSLSHQYFPKLLKWHPIDLHFHKSHSSAHEHVSSAQSPVTASLLIQSQIQIPYQRYKNPNPPHFSDLISLHFLPLTWLQPLWSPCFLNIPSMLPLQSLGTCCCFLCLDSHRCLYYLFSHYI